MAAAIPQSSGRDHEEHVRDGPTCLRIFRRSRIARNLRVTEALLFQCLITKFRRKKCKRQDLSAISAVNSFLAILCYKDLYIHLIRRFFASITCFRITFSALSGLFSLMA